MPLPSSPGDEAVLTSEGLVQPTDKTFDERLRDDLARLAIRENSEEGIPVFLACMNLVPDKAAKLTPPPFSAALAASFHRSAEAFQRIRPDAKADDVASVIGVIADRNFATGNTKGDI